MIPPLFLETARKHIRFMMTSINNVIPIICLAIAAASLIVVGCGTTNSRRATEQLIVSDAVDRSVAEIDFSDLSGESVYFDTRYINDIKGVDFVNVDYVISSLRQQMFAAGCRLQDNMQDADYVVEARVGTLGLDGHEVNYGVPSNNLLGAVSAVIPNSPPTPVFPEISLAKRNNHFGAAKIGVFAYHRESKTPVWQSGIVQKRSSAMDMWLMGAGPFQTGTIYKRARFAGEKIDLPLVSENPSHDQRTPPIPYHSEVHFSQSPQPAKEPNVSAAGFQIPIADEGQEDAASDETNAEPTND